MASSRASEALQFDFASPDADAVERGREVEDRSPTSKEPESSHGL